MELLQEYPGTKELPPEVAQRVAAGETPLAAMRAFEAGADARTACGEGRRAEEQADSAGQRGRLGRQREEKRRF